MFRKILIANRGEIAVRIIRTCREIGIQTVALYEQDDNQSLHVRMADECVELISPLGFMDQQAIIQIALDKGAQAIHPGYGFLAERLDFCQACEAAGLIFIGPPARVIGIASDKIEALNLVDAAGIRVVNHSTCYYEENDISGIQKEAIRLGFPIVVKSCLGGRGRGERLVHDPERLEEAIARAQAEAFANYGSRRIYLEKAIINSHMISIDVIADQFGHWVQLVDQEGSLIYGNQKWLVEAPAPCLSEEQRQYLRKITQELTQIFQVENLVSFEFIIDHEQNIYFSELKPRIMIEHPVTEMVTRLDLVHEQIRIASGESLRWTQDDLPIAGWAMQCRIAAEDPWRNFFPSPGQLRIVRFPGGQDVRVDTYVYSGCNIPALYDPLIAKLAVWGPDRLTCLRRITVALEELKISGTPTNLLVLQKILTNARVIDGSYTTSLRIMCISTGNGVGPEVTSSDNIASSVEGVNDFHLRDLAIAAAIFYLRRSQSGNPIIPERFKTAWHHKSRRLPE